MASNLKTTIVLASMAQAALGQWWNWNGGWHPDHHSWASTYELSSTSSSTATVASSVPVVVSSSSKSVSSATTTSSSKTVTSSTSTASSKATTTSVVVSKSTAGSSKSALSSTATSSYTPAKNGSYGPGASQYTAPADFPTSAFPSYYPTPAGQEPQPKLYDPVLNYTFPLNLTNPDTIPTSDPDPIILPIPIANLSASQQQQVVDTVVAEVKSLLANPNFSSNCTKCIAALSVGKTAAILAPELVPETMVNLCIAYKFHSNATCEEDFAADTFGAIWTQVLAYGDMSGLDAQYVCQSIGGFCPAPGVSPLNTTGLFPKPKPANAKAPPASGKRIKVAHLSDFHIDPRYKVGSEANCTSGLCCRSNNFNTALPSGAISLPAPEFGSFKCDTPYDLGVSALQAVGPLTGTSNDSPLAFTVYTGDLVAHDPQSQLSRAFTEYAEDASYYLFKEYLTGPVFPVLGNHDSNPEAIDAPHSLPGPLGQQQSWNYDHVASLWTLNGWLDQSHADQARTHYGGYSIKTAQGLRIIAWNTDFWYKSNFLNFINTTNPDVSGTFKWMIGELQAAEDAGERVWIIGHVLSGFDGSNPLPNPTNLFYQIVERYSPHVIANVFFGHTHEDEFMIYYSNNGTVQSLATALNTGWIGPSVTSLTNLNSGFRLYEVDTGSFDIYDAYTFYADVSSFPTLNATGHGPVFKLEYSSRDTYGPQAGWPADAPLNGTFWHSVTEAMQKNNTLVSIQNTYQGKSSIMSPNCTNAACANARICYLRSGSVALGRACPQGYGSVQSKFTPSS